MDTNWMRNWIQNKLTGGHNIWDDWVRKKIDESQHRVTWASREGADTSRLEWTRQRAEPWCWQGIQQHEGAGVPYSTAEGRRLLVFKDAEGKLMESRQAEARRLLMAVKPMAQQGQWVCVGLDRAFAYKIFAGRVVPFESTPNGWNLTVELEAPTDANNELQEVMDIMMTEKRSEQTEKLDHTRRLPHAIKLTGRNVFFTPFWVAGKDL